MHDHAESQVKTRSDAVLLTSLKSLDEAPEQEFKKGEAAGIRLFLVMPQNLIEAADLAVKQLTGEEAEDDEQSEDLVDPESLRR